MDTKRIIILNNYSSILNYLNIKNLKRDIMAFCISEERHYIMLLMKDHCYTHQIRLKKEYANKIIPNHIVIFDAVYVFCHYPYSYLKGNYYNFDDYKIIRF